MWRRWWGVRPAEESDAIENRLVYMRCRPSPCVCPLLSASQSSTTCRNQPENDSEYSWAWNGNVGINAKEGCCFIRYVGILRFRFPRRCKSRRSGIIFEWISCDLKDWMYEKFPDFLVLHLFWEQRSRYTNNPNPAIDATLISSSAVPPSASPVTGLDGTP